MALSSRFVRLAIPMPRSRSLTVTACNAATLANVFSVIGASGTTTDIASVFTGGGTSWLDPRVEQEYTFSIVGQGDKLSIKRARQLNGGLKERDFDRHCGR